MTSENQSGSVPPVWIAVISPTYDAAAGMPTVRTSLPVFPWALGGSHVDVLAGINFARRGCLLHRFTLRYRRYPHHFDGIEIYRPVWYHLCSLPIASILSKDPGFKQRDHFG